jgi:uncharacterized protein YndB with AHSA1/START domain
MHKIDPKLDLVLERTADVKPEQIFKALIDAEALKQWFCPRPWRVVRAEVDPQPGGIFLTEMQGPNGETGGVSEAGCFLEVIPNKKVVWTSALGPGYRPLKSADPVGFQMTAVILIEPNGEGSKYTAIAVHADEASRKTHEQMGFHQGWGIAFDQMIEYIKK